MSKLQNYSNTNRADGVNTKGSIFGDNSGFDKASGDGDHPAAGTNDYYCTITKQYYSNSTCTSAVSYTNKTANFVNQCISTGGTGTFITACNSSGWTTNSYTQAGCIGSPSTHIYVATTCYAEGSMWYKSYITPPDYSDAKTAFLTQSTDRNGSSRRNSAVALAASVAAVSAITTSVF